MHFHVPNLLSSLLFPPFSPSKGKTGLGTHTCLHISYPRYVPRWALWPLKDTNVCPGCDLLTGFPPVRADEVNRPQDKGWRLTSAVIRLCGSATMVIERDNEQPDVAAEMRRRNAGFIVATFSEHDSSALRGNSWWCSRKCSRQRDSPRFECASKLLRLIKSPFN